MNHFHSLSLFIFLFFNHLHAERCILTLRNKILRMYIYSCEKKMIQKISTTYHFCLSKCYDAQLFYYKLSDEEKEILDTIFSLCY